jgi:hypothetical protein
MSNRDYYQNPNNNPYKVRKEQSNLREESFSPRAPLDFNEHRICPACGKIIKISHNFCKFCGSDLSSLAPIGKSDEVTKTLADTAISDPSPEVRKEAVASLAEFGEYEVLGVLSYILLNDPNEDVRSEAADELGKFHHPHSLDVFAKALKDKSPIVRKKAIDGLKNIKKMIKKREPLEEKPERVVKHVPDAEEIPIMDLEAPSEDLQENEKKNQKDEPEKDHLDSVESSEEKADENKEEDYYRL